MTTTGKNLDEWCTEASRLATDFEYSFQGEFGYPPGEHVIRPVAQGVAEETLESLKSWDPSGELAAFYSQVAEVELPDLGPGYFIHPADEVVQDITSGSQPSWLTGTLEGPIVVFGSDGGGSLFAIHAPSASIVRLSGGALLGKTYDTTESGCQVTAPSLFGFLDFLLTALRQR